MNLNDITVIKALNARMIWLTQRQKVLAHNVANADTPNYMARDVSEATFKEMMRENSDRIRLASTSDGHLAGNSRNGSSRARSQEDAVESSPTGNNVVLEEEMMKVSETAADYELMTNLYKKSVGLLKLAISRPRG